MLATRTTLGRRGGSRRAGLALAPPSRRVVLVVAAVASTLLACWFTRGEAASHAMIVADAELTWLLHFMTALKCLLGAGALWLVCLRFRFAISWPLASAYIAGGMVMAAGPGVMWNIAHIGLGALLFYGGLASLFIVARIDEGARWGFGKRQGRAADCPRS